ncbi:hypothetical protein [Ramlibacter sp. WS9]|uniref:hypothetical protein n=1 Tax=Ramlibacter sp. WS9 TaxID=1882741 RepID=UPI0011418CFB|nr:hypothetical protein [Ramlibacter sp. WS9]
MSSRAVLHLKLSVFSCMFGAMATLAKLASTTWWSYFHDTLLLGRFHILASFAVGFVVLSLALVSCAIGVAAWSILYSRRFSLCERQDAFVCAYPKGSWSRFGLKVVRLVSPK